MPEPVKPQRCAVCGLSLSQFVPLDGGPAGWHHERPVDQDHIAVPVDRDQLPGRARCDFCDAEGVTPWLVITNGPIWQASLPGQLHIDSPLWAACELCKSDITRHRWTSMYSRQRANSNVRMEGHRRYTLAMWARVEAAIDRIVPFSEELTAGEPIQSD